MAKLCEADKNFMQMNLGATGLRVLTILPVDETYAEWALDFAHNLPSRRAY